MVTAAVGTGLEIDPHYKFLVWMFRCMLACIDAFGLLGHMACENQFQKSVKISPLRKLA